MNMLQRAVFAADITSCIVASGLPACAFMSAHSFARVLMSAHGWPAQGPERYSVRIHTFMCVVPVYVCPRVFLGMLVRVHVCVCTFVGVCMFVCTRL